MILFSDVTFYVVLAFAIIPAAILGFIEKPISTYGFVVSVIFLLANFYSSIVSLIYFIIFLIIQLSVVRWFLKNRSCGKNKIDFYSALLFSLLPLLLYKMGTVFDKNIMGFLGISYITFKSLQIIIEVQDGIIKKISIFNYLYFLLFFPTFTSGPIDRSRRFEKDIKNILTRSEYLQLFSDGIFYLFLGAVYKFVLSAIFVDWNSLSGLFFNENINFLSNQQVRIVDKYFYGFHLFFDFAGYSLMAVGISQCFGIKTPQNFDKPFISLDIKDFWNRWHITLSYWFRDFVFTRIVMFGIKRKWFDEKDKTAYVAYLVNMLIMGVWHGLNLNYTYYGLYHGILLVLTDLYQKRSTFYCRYKENKLYKILSWFITFNLVMLGFAIFGGKI